jgi:hypothetical protein
MSSARVQKRAERIRGDERFGQFVAPLLHAALDGAASQNNISAARRAGCRPYLADVTKRRTNTPNPVPKALDPGIR